jgi:hypothetical protein
LTDISSCAKEAEQESALRVIEPCQHGKIHCKTVLVTIRRIRIEGAEWTAVIYTCSAFKRTHSHTAPRHSHEATPAHAIARKTEAVCHAVAAALPAGAGVDEAGGGAGGGRSPHSLMKLLIWDAEHAGRSAVYSAETGHRLAARGLTRARAALLLAQPVLE